MPATLGGAGLVCLMNDVHVTYERRIDDACAYACLRRWES